MTAFGPGALLALAALLGAVTAACGSDRTSDAESNATLEDAGAGGAAGNAADARAPAEDDGGRGSGGAPDDGGGDARPAPVDAPSPTDGARPSLGCDGPGSRFATAATDHSFGPGQNVGQDLFPAPVLGPPRGGGECQGSTDVVSLGNGGYVVLAFEGNAIVDGPGPDFIVFENAFYTSCDPNRPFAELGTVAVSPDGDRWHEFPCTATAAPYGACSGTQAVLANADSNDIDATDPAVAGGDAYDLADIALGEARFVRITDRPDLQGFAGVYDLDAVAIVNPECP